MVEIPELVSVADVFVIVFVVFVAGLRYGGNLLGFISVFNKRHTLLLVLYPKRIFFTSTSLLHRPDAFHRTVR